MHTVIRFQYGLSINDRNHKMTYSYFLCLSHDVDRVYKTYQVLYYSAKAITRGDLGGFAYHLSSTLKDNPYWNFEKIMDIEEDLGVKSTFFFLNESIPFNPVQFSNWKLSLGRYSWDDPRVSKMIRDLDSGGWEIGLHGSYNSYRDASLLSTEKSKLEEIIGHEVKGVRQHYLNLTDETWIIQRNLGLLYDSTLGSTVDIGFPEGRYHPFKPFKDEFVVVPLVIMDSCLMSKKNPREEYRRILDVAEERSAFVTINWHQRVFNEKEFPGYSEVYKEIIQESLQRGAWVSPIYEALNFLSLEMVGR